MPEKTCGRKYCSPRLKLGEDSLASGKSRTGNHQLPPQIHHQNVLKMLIQGISGVQRNGGCIKAEWEFFSSSCIGIHSGVGDFRGGPGAWNMVDGFISDVQLVGYGTIVRD